jgi:hypothetical protein
VDYKGKLVAIGDFYDATFSISRVAIFDGNTWNSLGNGIKGSTSFVYDLAVFKDTLYIAGTWPKSQGNPSNYLMKWDGNQLYDANFDTQYLATNFITSLLPHGDRLYVFGSFNRVAGAKAFGVTFYRNGSWITPNDSVHNNGIRDAVIFNNTIYVSGNFKSIAGDSTIRNFAKLNCPDFDASLGCISAIKDGELSLSNLLVFPNPTNSDFKVKGIPSEFFGEKMELYTSNGQKLMSAIIVDNSMEFHFKDIAEGIYTLRIVSRFKIAPARICVRK